MPAIITAQHPYVHGTCGAANLLIYSSESKEFPSSHTCVYSPPANYDPTNIELKRSRGWN